MMTRIRTLLLQLPRSILRLQKTDPRVPARRRVWRRRLRLWSWQCSAALRLQDSHDGVRAERNAGPRQPAGGQACAGGGYQLPPPRQNGSTHSEVTGVPVRPEFFNLAAPDRPSASAYFRRIAGRADFNTHFLPQIINSLLDAVPGLTSCTRAGCATLKRLKPRSWPAAQTLRAGRYSRSLTKWRRSSLGRI